MIIKSYQDAKDKLLLGDFSCETYFEENKLALELGYCELFKGELNRAKEIFQKIDKIDFRADWASKLIQFIERYVTVIPSYFQIRNFLEIDLNLLIQAGQAEYVENIINGVELFYSVNPESYKFIARVMLYNQYNDLAFYFLKKAKDKFYYDPEMHFMLANYYIQTNEIQQAKKSIDTCLEILPAYFPAKNLLAKLDKLN